MTGQSFQAACQPTGLASSCLAKASPHSRLTGHCPRTLERTPGGERAVSGLGQLGQHL